MGAQKIPSEPILLDVDGLRGKFSLKWSDKTLRRRIKDGFPAIKDGGKLLFDPKAVFDYFKRRTIR